MIGKQVGSYRIHTKIGEGGMGVVYRAEDVLLNRPVAIKVMNPAEAQQPDFKGRFLREAQVASSLNHPHIVQIYQLLEEDGSSFIVMEFVDGPSLHRRLKVAGKLPADEAIAIVRQVASALAAAHAQGLVHRDIKPGNIVFDRSGKAKLLDFGLAKWRLPPPGRVVYRTAENEIVMGTVDYTSPELALKKEVDARSDLFSLGIVFHQMLTATLPFPGSNSMEVLHLITRREKAVLDMPGVAADLETIVGRLLEKDPADRYQSADDLLKDLDAARTSLETGQPLLNPDQGKHRRVAKFALLAVAGLIGAFLILYYAFVG